MSNIYILYAYAETESFHLCIDKVMKQISFHCTDFPNYLGLLGMAYAIVDTDEMCYSTASLLGLHIRCC